MWGSYSSDYEEYCLVGYKPTEVLENKRSAQIGSRSSFSAYKTPWRESSSELYLPSERRLSTMLVSTFAERECDVVSVTDPYGLILGFLDRSRYIFFQVPPQLCSWGWVDPVPDPPLLRKSGSGGNPTQTSGYVARNSGHHTTGAVTLRLQQIPIVARCSLCLSPAP
jgi:hypothetical protein